MVGLLTIAVLWVCLYVISGKNVYLNSLVKEEWLKRIGV